MLACVIDLQAASKRCLLIHYADKRIVIFECYYLVIDLFKYLWRPSVSIARPQACYAPGGLGMSNVEESSCLSCYMASCCRKTVYVGQDEFAN